MGILTHRKTNNTPDVKFDKEQVIQDIKEGLKRDFPEWVWFTSPEYAFDLIVMRTKTVNEQITLGGNDWTVEQTKFEQKQYQFVYGVCIRDSFSALYEGGLPDNFNGALILVTSSARELFRRLYEHR